jgi:LytS/YehU family sensor histidine kinase
VIADELAFLNLYLEIEKVRFGNRLHINSHISETLVTQKIPSHMLQPLVENAIKYGLYGNIGSLNIDINIQEVEHYISISIRNPFDENAVNTSKGTGYGITSIAQKLKLLYGRTDLIKTTKHNQEFEVQLLIPIMETTQTQDL